MSTSEINKLNVTKKREDEKITHICYRNGRIYKYYNKSFIDDETHLIKYTSAKGLNISITNYDRNIITKVKENLLIQQEIEKLYSLKNIKPIVLTFSEQLLPKIYNLFYNKHPNFSDSSTHIEVQAMINILQCKGIYIDKEISFENDSCVPFSPKVKEMVSNLVPHLDYNYDINIDEYTAKKIREIGRIIRNNIIDNSSNNIKENTEDGICMLNIISSLLYYNNDAQYKKNEHYKRNYFCYPEEKVNDGLELIKKINKKIRNIK